MLEQTVTIVSNERNIDSYFRLVLRAPQITPLIQPGQFAHVRVLPMKDALLRRPFSIFQVEGDTFSILYKTVGKGTDALSRMRSGEEVSVIAPLGHGFSVPSTGAETPLLVAGRRRIDILCEKEFAGIGWEVRPTTEDGSHGEKGLVTQPLLATLRSSRGNEAQTKKSAMDQSLLTSAAINLKIFACGPTPMLKAVGKLAGEFNVPCELSMDEHMCCGVGTCLTCVIKVKTGDSWEYQRTCTEGPVFDSRDIVWEEVK